MDANEPAPSVVSVRLAWLVLGAAAIAHPVILYLRALITGFSDSGLVGGTLSFTLFTIMFMIVVGGLFAAPLQLATKEDAVGRLPLAAIVLTVGAAHVVVALGVSTTGSNLYGFAYPVFAVLAAAIVLALRRGRPSPTTARP